MINKEKLRKIEHTLITRYEDHMYTVKGPRGEGLLNGDFVAYTSEGEPIMHIEFNNALYEECKTFHGCISSKKHDFENSTGSIKIHINKLYWSGSPNDGVYTGIDALKIAESLVVIKFTRYDASSTKELYAKLIANDQKNK